MIKSRRMGWESQKERDHREGINIGRRIILKWILEK
jgi:hypothetical protein